MGSLEDQLLAMRYLLTNTTNQISLNNKGEKIWATREKIMKAQWPADEAKQQEVLALLEADLATGTPADPPIPPLTQLVVNPDEVDNPDDSNDTPLEQLQNKLDAMQKTAQAVLDKLNGYANAGEAMVDWPTDASTEAGLSTWLAAQGVSETDLTSDSKWLTDLGDTVVNLDDIDAAIDFADLNSGDKWVKKLTSSDDSELVAWDGSKLMLETGAQNVEDWWKRDFPDGTVLLNWSGAGQISGKLYTVEDSKGGEAKFFVPKESTLGTIVPDGIGKTYTVNGKQVRLWSDGTDVYTVDLADMTVHDHLNYATHLFQGDAGYTPAKYFSSNGGMTLTTATPLITSVDGDRRAKWASVFETKINTLQTNTATFTSSIASTNIQVQEALTKYNVASSWTTNLMKAWGDMLTTYLGKI